MSNEHKQGAAKPTPASIGSELLRAREVLRADAAAEIDRLRLTDAERKAIRFAAGEAAAIAEQNPTSKFWADHALCLRSAAERLG